MSTVTVAMVGKSPAHNSAENTSPERTSQPLQVSEPRNKCTVPLDLPGRVKLSSDFNCGADGNAKHLLCLVLPQQGAERKAKMINRSPPGRARQSCTGVNGREDGSSFVKCRLSKRVGQHSGNPTGAPWTDKPGHMEQWL